MANPLLLKRRIKTARNVSKTTRAMQMISASKLKRAQDAASSSKPYVEKLSQLSKSVSQKIGRQASHPYLEQQNPGRTLLVVLSPDKGLCGGLIANCAREFMRNYEKEDIIVITIGKKMEKIIIRLGKTLIAAFPFGNTTPKFEIILPVVGLINEHYLSKKVDKVQVLSTRFKSFFSQTAHITTLLPITMETLLEENETKETDVLFEPNANQLLPLILKQYLEMSMYQFVLENYLCEQAARMIAMQNATQNAKDMIFDLLLEYNKARQEKITNEILDISAGAFMTT